MAHLSQTHWIPEDIRVRIFSIFYPQSRGSLARLCDPILRSPSLVREYLRGRPSQKSHSSFFLSPPQHSPRVRPTFFLGKVVPGS